MKLKASWERAWNLGKEMSVQYDTEWAATNALPYSILEDMMDIVGFEQFFHAGFVGREPEWVEAIRYGEIPAEGRSMNWADHTWEPGVSVVKIIRTPEDENYESIYDVTVGWQGREKIKVAGWWLGLTGSDGEATLLGCVKA